MIPDESLESRPLKCVGLGGHQRCAHFSMPWKCAKSDVPLRVLLRDPSASCPVGSWGKAVSQATGSKIIHGAIHGATGITKALLHIGRAAPAVIDQRMAVCRGCPRLRPGGRCDACGCFVSLKTTLATESCPVGKWSAAAPAPASPGRGGGCGGCGGKK